MVGLMAKKKRGLKGFCCKKCGNPFYVIVDDPEYIADDIGEIKRYRKEGYEFVKIKHGYDLCACINK